VCSSGLPPLERDQLNAGELMQEVWQPVVGYEGRYEVSDTGRVKGPRGPRKPIFHTNGYVRVGLWHRGTNKLFYIHRLVATHFIPNPNQCPQVNHKDGNKINNLVSNLEWCTASENVIHAVRLFGLHGENHHKSKLTSEQVRSIRSDTRLHREIAADYAIVRSVVSEIKSGKIWNWLP
jgi:hypothetical protein